MILVSACLWGLTTRYDGRHSLCQGLKDKLAGQNVLPACPEELLGVPRQPVAFVGASRGCEGQELLDGKARLLTVNGADYSQAFIDGARRVLQLALEHKVHTAYLKDRSPSCGYDPQGLNPKGGPALGVLTTLLLHHGIRVHEVRADSCANTADN